MAKEVRKIRPGTGTTTFKPGNPGKPKGALNKTTVAAKEAIAQAFDRNGGVDRLVAWIAEDIINERAFLTAVWPKLLPLQLTGDGGGPVQIHIHKP